MKYLIIADVHGNLPALDAVLAAHTDVDGILFLGDAPSDGPHPNAVIQRLVEVGALCIRGNHDTELLNMDLSQPPATPDQAWRHWCRKQLSEESLAVMTSWPEMRHLDIDGRPLCMIHGLLPPQYGKRLWPDSSDEAYAYLAAQCSEDTILVGHSHIQSIVQQVGRIFCNPGSIGQQRLGVPQACYALLEDGQLRLDAEPYDVESVARDMATLPIDADWLAERIAAFVQGRLPDTDNIGRLARLETGEYR